MGRPGRCRWPQRDPFDRRARRRDGQPRRVMARYTQAKHGTPLRKVLLAMALGAGHANANAHGTTALALGRRGGNFGGGIAAPAPAPLGDAPADSRGADGGDCAARAWSATVQLMALCRKKNWVLSVLPDAADRFVVTTGTSSAAADQDAERARKGVWACAGSNTAAAHRRSPSRTLFPPPSSIHPDTT